MIKQKGTQPSRHLQKGADVEAKGDLSCRVVRRSREAGDERTVEAADARLGFVGVDRGLPQIGNEGEKEEHIYTGSWRDECFTENAKQDSTQLCIPMPMPTTMCKQEITRTDNERDRAWGTLAATIPGVGHKNLLHLAVVDANVMLCRHAENRGAANARRG